jgi:hypothetical protein
MIANYEIYEDEIGYQKGEIQKKKIVELEPFQLINVQK